MVSSWEACEDRDGLWHDMHYCDRMPSGRDPSTRISLSNSR
jgi:hypothetical protein